MSSDSPLTLSDKDNNDSNNTSNLSKYGACELCSKAKTMAKNNLQNQTISTNDNQQSSNNTLNINTITDKNADIFDKRHTADKLAISLNSNRFINLRNENGQPINNAQEEYENCSILHRMAKTIPCLGIIFSLCASIFLCSAGMLVKMTRSVHGIQVAVFRAMIQLVLYGGVIAFRRIRFVPERDEFLPVMGRAFLGACSITCSYYALKLIPLGDATTIRFSLPIWTLIISYLVLNESCGLFKIGAVIVSVSGVVLIAKPDDCVYLLHKLLYLLEFESESDFSLNLKEYQNIKNNSSTTDLNDNDSVVISKLVPLNVQQFEGSLLALSSSICLAMSLVALRLCRKTHVEITILWLSIISIIIGTITLISINEWGLPKSWFDVMLIILNGLCGSIGQWFITSALKIEQSGVISLARTFDIEVAFMYSAFVLHEVIRTTSIIGSVMVSMGVIAVVLPKWLDSRKNRGESEVQQQQQQQSTTTISGELTATEANNQEPLENGHNPGANNQQRRQQKQQQHQQ